MSAPGLGRWPHRWPQDIRAADFADSQDQFPCSLQVSVLNAPDVIGFADAFADVQKAIAVGDRLLVSRAGGGVDRGRATGGDSICIRVGCRGDTDKRD
jgi:hypothetical protein